LSVKSKCAQTNVWTPKLARTVEREPHEERTLTEVAHTLVMAAKGTRGRGDHPAARRLATVGLAALAAVAAECRGLAGVLRARVAGAQVVAQPHVVGFALQTMVFPGSAAKAKKFP
jgi:hypothetical protein